MAKIYTIRIGGRLAKVVTVQGLADIMGYSPFTIRQYEKRGILPPANYRINVTSRDANGRRVYLESTAEKLRDLFKEKVRQGKQIEESVKVEIKQIFVNELNAT